MIQIRPSGSTMWTKCAANPLFSAHSPKQPDSDAAREGTCAAWVAECVLKGDATIAEDLLGKTHENGWFVTPDMVNYVQGYIDLIQSRGGVTTAECFVRLNEFIAGTFDSAVDATAQNGTLHIDDLKYGHKIVEVFENTQVIIYGEAEARRLEANGVVILNVQLGIYQPRAWHPDGYYRTWTMSRAELRMWGQWIENQGALCQVPEPVATPGSQCEYCTGALRCAAAAATLQHAFEIIRSSRHREPSTEELVAELDFLDKMEAVMKGRKTAISTEASARMDKGEHIRGWYKKPRKGNRQFKYSRDVMLALTGIDPEKKTMMTPAEFEREGADVKAVKALTYQPDIPSVLSRFPEAVIRKAFGT